ncbi:MAG TPA: 5'/3'-nucleotidase SurE [Anaerolineaceae bacterium]
MTKRIQILLTNDDGIQSPGIWAAASALSKLGFVTVAAPREQASSTGRSLPLSSDGKIEPTTLRINDQDWTVYAIGGSPAQSVLHAVLEIMPEKPDLVVSGINYGENVGTGITISGTVGAAIEGAAMGIPAMAVSVQASAEAWYNYIDLDFSTAAYFTHYFARKILAGSLPPDVDMLKVEVPSHATPETPWRVTRLARHRYYIPFIERSGAWSENGKIGARVDVSPEEVAPDSDIYTVRFDQMISVTPISLDMTSRIPLNDLEADLRRRA